MAQISNASARWEGELKSGAGTVSTGSGAVNGVPYDFGKRFEGAEGANPEELIGAAHAGCYAMALSGDLGKAGFKPERIDVQAQVTLDFVEGKPTVTAVHLEVAARVPDASEAAFKEAAEGAKAGCPISRLLKAEITLAARLE